MGLQQAGDNRNIDKFLDKLLTQLRNQEDRIAQLEGNEGARYLSLSEDNTSNPPTDAQLDSIYGTPATVGKGFVSLLNDAGAGTNFYLVASDGTNWWVFTGTVAV